MKLCYAASPRGSIPLLQIHGDTQVWINCKHSQKPAVKQLQPLSINAYYKSGILPVLGTSMKIFDKLLGLVELQMFFGGTLISVKFTKTYSSPNSVVRTALTPNPSPRAGEGMIISHSNK